MNKLYLLLLPCFVVGFTITNDGPSVKPSNSKTVTGFIYVDDSNHDTFFIQDIESGDSIELYFENEEMSELTFEDFSNVEIIGRYDKSINRITVDEILMIENHGNLEVVYKEP